ncbi:MAG: VIT domain-containing protein, partial [Candidatus Cryosericum sp.]
PFVPLRHVEISGEVTGPVAGMQVVHVFSYTKEQCSKVIEAAYRFPLPGDAAVTGVSVRFGDVELQAVLEPRAQAEKDYADAKKDRRQAALVTREAADVFTLRVAGIKPGQDVRVETAFVQLARAEGSGWSLRIPLTVPVRYTRSDESPAAGAARPLAQAADPGYRASLDLTVFDASGVASPTHALSLERDGVELHAHFQDGNILPDCDAVITWQPAGDDQRTTLSAFTAHREGRTPFLALVTPPSHEQKLVPRELTVLVDHSGSMEGAKWDAADWAVGRLIGMLTADDRFRLGVFHNTVAWWSDAPKAMDDAARKDAAHFLESHKDSGGTELGVALEQALMAPRPTGAFSRQVLIVTDAQVSDDGRLIRLAEEESKRADRRRISILCVDSAPNEALARQLAEAGGGSDRYVTSNPEGEDITTALDEIVDTWARPIATGLRLEVQTDALYATSRRPTKASADGWCSLDLGDLPADRPLWASGEAAKGGQPLELRLVDGHGEVLATWTEAEGAQVHGGVAALVGARRLQQLEAFKDARYTSDELTKRVEELGVTPAEGGTEGGTLYPENQPAVETLTKLICQESLRSGIASTETAFVAVRTESGKSVERTIIVASATPQGWEDAGPVMMAAPMMMNQVNSPPLSRSVYETDVCCSDSGPAYLSRSARSASPRLQAAVAHQPRASAVTLFNGVPTVGGERTVLAERTIGLKGAKGLQVSHLLSLIAEGDTGTFAEGAELLLFVGDMARARARVRLSDLLGGATRPLNITCTDGQTLRLVLLISGSPTQPFGHLKITLGVA